MRTNAAAWAVMLGVVVISVSALAFSERSHNNVVASNQRVIACLARWTNATTQRSNILTTAASNRQDALDALIRSISLHPKSRAAAKAAFAHAYRRYIGASDDYKRLVRRHPVPRSPKFACRRQ